MLSCVKQEKTEAAKQTEPLLKSGRQRFRRNLKCALSGEEKVLMKVTPVDLYKF